MDPTNHNTVYASATGGVFKSADGGISWSLIQPLTDTDYVQRISVSPANPNVLYLGVGKTSSGGVFKFWRSSDGGATWELLDEYMNMTCGWVVPILQPHATDENRLFRAGGCFASRDFYDRLYESTDRGTSWTQIFGVGMPGIGARDSQHPQFAFPASLTGGHGAAPARYYLATFRDSRVDDGASLFRSDDDGQTWTEVYTSRPATEPDGAIVRVRNPTYDPAQPDTVYIGLNVFSRAEGASSRTFVRAGILVSHDGGGTWNELGRQDLAAIYDLALGVDGRNLFVATGDGLLRFELD